MPRRNRSNPPLSFFDDGDNSRRTRLADGDDEEEVKFVPVHRDERPAVHVPPHHPLPPMPATRAREGVERTTVFKKKAGRVAPAKATKAGTVVNSKKWTYAQIKHCKDEMHVHYEDTKKLLSQNKTWEGHKTFNMIQTRINKVKTENMDPIWEEQGKHFEKLEKIHATNIINVHDYDFKTIHANVSEFAIAQGLTNRLTLESPMESEHGLYANVALAWLFAAKKQLMVSLEAYIKKHGAKTEDEKKFLRHSEKGNAARVEFKRLKATLKKREPRVPPFADHAILEEQYKMLHPHHTPASSSHQHRA